MKIKIPRLSYPLSRDIESTRLSAAVYGLGLFGFVLLLVINVALTAYEVILTTKDDFNATQSHWYSRLTRTTPKPGSLCATYNLTVGEQISTTNNIFQYTLLGIKGSQPALPYAGTPLNDCDIILVDIDVDMTAGSLVDIIAYVGCSSGALPIVAKTLWSSSFFGYSATSVDVDTVRNFFGDDENAELYGTLGAPYEWIHYSIVKAAANIRKGFENQISATPTTAPQKLSINAIPNCTPDPSLARYKSAYCQNNDNVPITWIYDWTQGYLLDSNGQQLPLSGMNQNITGFNWVTNESPYDTAPNNYSTYYLMGVNDFVQLFASAVRLDWGIIHPNNPYLDISYMNTTIQENPLRDQIVGQSGPDPAKTYGMGAFSPDKSAYINAQYLCRFTYATSWGHGLINVTVATCSLFTTGWGILMFAIAFLVKKQPTAEFCAGHSASIDAGRGPRSRAFSEDRPLFSPALSYSEEKKALG